MSNINTAIAQANRFSRAIQIIKDGYCFTVENSGSIAVCKPGRLAASYWITDGECDCPDRMKGNVCKHELAWEILEDERANMEAQCAEYDRRAAMEF